MWILSFPWRLIFSAVTLLTVAALIVRWRWLSRRSRSSSLTPEQIASMDLDSLLLALDNLLIMRSHFGEIPGDQDALGGGDGADQGIVGQIDDAMELLRQEISTRQANLPTE